MGFIGKAVIYTGLIAAGYGVCYFGSVDRKYRAVTECSKLYVQDKQSGLLAEVSKFEIKPNSDASKGICPKTDGIVERLERAYNELTR